jgi:hypothetical protein
MADLLGDFDDLPGPTESSNPPTTNQSVDLDSMLGDANDDDLYGGPSEPTPFDGSASIPDAPSSALIAWKRQRDAEIAEKDAQDAEAAQQRRQTARQTLDNHYEVLRNEQEKKAKANALLDEEKLSELEREGGTWQKVLHHVDLQRSDLHVKDVSKFKTLLIQLKNS